MFKAAFKFFCEACGLKHETDIKIFKAVKE